LEFGKKEMNKKVLKTTIYLCWAFLVCFALLKTVFAEQFLVAVNNENIIKTGRFIDQHTILQQAIYVLTTFATYHFFLCACIQKWSLTKMQYLKLAIIVVVTNAIKFFIPSLSLIINMLVMVILPYRLKADYKSFVTIFVAHYLGQLAISFIRSQPLDLADVNTITALICTVDMYIWLLLYYLYFNIYKENFIMGNIAPPLWGDKSKTIEKEIAKLDEKIASTTDEKKLAKYKEMRAEYVSMLETSDKA
jgi:hypothetical protein